MNVNQENFTQAMKSDGKSIAIVGSSDAGFLIIVQFKKNSNYNPVLSDFQGYFLNFQTLKNAAAFLSETCGYQGTVTVRDKAQKTIETRKIKHFLGDEEMDKSKNLDVETMTLLSRSGLISEVVLREKREEDGPGWYLEISTDFILKSPVLHTKRGEVKIFKTADAAIKEVKSMGFTRNFTIDYDYCPF